MDLSAVSAQLLPSTNQDLPSPLGGGKVLGAASSNGANANTGVTSPSADGFLQVLDMFLGGSPLPSSLLASTAITQSPSAAVPTTTAPADHTAPTEKSDSNSELDTTTAEQIASLLQMLGFQVKPQEIQNLSPLDREQLGTALEFVQRNLERGIDPSKIAENAAMLLPRPWALDDADGSPMGTSSVSQASTDSNKALPPDTIQNLKDLRAKIQASLGQGEMPGQKTSVDSNVAGATQNLGKATSASDAGGGSDSFSQNAGQSQKTSSAVGEKKNQSGENASAWIQQFQQASTSKLEDASSLVPRHIPPGGTSSELIGRQVLEKVQIQLTEGHRELKLRLWPEELGEVRLSLKMNDNDKVHASMVVENDAVRQAMLDAAPQLKDALSRHGLDLEHLSVSVGQKNTPEPGGDGQAAKDQHQGSRKGSGEGGWNDTEISVPEAVVLGEDTGIRNGQNTIDLWS